MTANAPLKTVTQWLANRSLRTKLILAMLSVTVASMSTATFFIYRTARDELAAQVGTNLKEKASTLALATGDVLADQVDKLQAFALGKLIQDQLGTANRNYGTQPEAIQRQLEAFDRQWIAAAETDELVQTHLNNEIAKELQQFHQAFPDHVEVFITDRYGALVGSTNRTSDYYQADEEWWQAAWNQGQGEIYIGQPEYDESSRSFSINIAVPIYQRQVSGVVNIAGILRSTYRVDRTLFQLLEGVQFGKTGKVHLFVSATQYVTRRRLAEVNASPLVQLQALAQDYGEFEYQGLPRLVSQAPMVASTQMQAIADLNWVAIAYQDRAEALLPLIVTGRTTLIITLGALLLAGILVLAIEQAINAPIRQLTLTARDIAAGNLDRQVQLKQDDEIGLLAASLNTMAQSLKASFATLEEKVKDRTAQLAQANQEIADLNQRLEAENIRMKTELDVTRQLQQMILPKEEELAQIQGLEIAGFMEPADEVGGDYYDVLQHNGRVKISIGDVTGHGLESGVLMIMVQTAVRTLLEHNEHDPRTFFDVLNRTIYNNVQRMGSERNLTLSLLDYQQDTLRLSGQHEEMIVVRAGGKVERIDTVDLGFPLGLEEDIINFIAHTHLQLHPGDVVVLYTDGITEAENLEQVHYGIERLCNIVSQHWQQSAQDIRQAVIDDVRQHIGTQKVYDDITLLVLKQKE